MLYSDIAFITFSICCDDNRELDAYPRVMSSHGRCKDLLCEKNKLGSVISILRIVMYIFRISCKIRKKLVIF